MIMPWTPAVDIPNNATSRDHAATVVVDNILHMVHIDSRPGHGELYHTIFDGDDEKPVLISGPIRSRMAPAIAELNGQLHMVHIDSPYGWQNHY
jgi:hypothetical protein